MDNQILDLTAPRIFPTKPKEGWECLKDLRDNNNDNILSVAIQKKCSQLTTGTNVEKVAIHS